MIITSTELQYGNTIVGAAVQPALYIQVDSTSQEKKLMHEQNMIYHRIGLSGAHSLLGTCYCFQTKSV